MTGRLHIYPSRANLVVIKQRNAAAVKGLALLKRKKDALELQIRALMAEIAVLEKTLEDLVREANAAFSRAKFANADLKPASILNVARPDTYLKINEQKVVGVTLPQFDLIIQMPRSLVFTGLSRGGIEVAKTRGKFQEALRTIISVASKKYAAKTLEIAVQQTTTRINGLEYVIIPLLQGTITYIISELEEYEREEFFRLKRSQASQRKVKEERAKLMLRYMQAHRFSLGDFDMPLTLIRETS